MRINLGFKLFIAIFATNVASVLAMGAIANYNLTNGFLGYLNQQALLRTQLIRDPLIQAYEAHDRSWQFLQDQQHPWFEILHRSTLSAPDGKRLASPPGDLPSADLLGANLRIGLYDAQRRHVIGAPPPNSETNPPHWTALREPGGRVIGWLMLNPLQKATSVADVRFERQQSRAIWLIAAIALVLSAILAYLMSRALLVPVRRLADAIHRLAAGHYDTRVPEQRGDEVGQLERDFNHLAHSLARNEAMRRHMMADISHELRTPLSIVRGELEALEDGVRAATPESLRSLGAEIELLNQLVSDLYDLSLSDAGALVYRKVEIDLVDMLAELRLTYDDRLDEAGLKPEWSLPDDEVIALADERRLTQLFRNLLENSLRYTDAPGQVRVALDVEGHMARIVIADSVPDVVEASRAQLFERFYRVEASRGRATGGAGLGLAICRNIVDAHGGTIEVATSALGGLQVTIWLPTV